MILVIDSATKVCSVALFDQSNLVACREELSEQYIHAEKLNPFIEELLLQSKISIKDLTAVAVSEGPGSYTGLRIGAASAKGLCFALGIPLIAVNPLEAMAKAYITAKGVELGVVIPMIDARRMEVFCEVYDSSGQCIQAMQPLIVDAHAFDAFEGPVYAIGDGAPKLVELFSDQPRIHVETQFESSARWLGPLAFDLFQQKRFADLAYFEPNYGKDFQTTAPKVR